VSEVNKTSFLGKERRRKEEGTDHTPCAMDPKLEKEGAEGEEGEGGGEDPEGDECCWGQNEQGVISEMLKEDNDGEMGGERRSGEGNEGRRMDRRK
jgi:hypothetical protein